MAANPEYLTPAHTPASSSFFFRLIEDLGKTLEPTETQLQTLERSYRSTGDFLVNCREFESQLVEIHPQGSRELGTITRPLRSTDGFDIDLVARIKREAWPTYSSTGGAALLLNRLHTAISRYADQHNLKLHRWERCVTLEYADGMCADIAPVIDWPSPTATHGELHGLIPDRELRSFHPTNPRGFTKLFNDVAAISPIFFANETYMDFASDARRADIAPLSKPDEVFGRLLCRLVQVLKLHRDVAFAGTSSLSDLAPSSVFLTALAAESYRIKAAIPHADQLDLFLDIIRSMPKAIRRVQMPGACEEWFVDNPTAPGDNLASSMNTSERQQAFAQWHIRLEYDVEQIIGAIDNRLGIDKVGTIITAVFGERASTAIRQTQLVRQSNDRQLGRVVAVTAAGLTLPMTAKSHTFFGK